MVYLDLSISLYRHVVYSVVLVEFPNITVLIQARGSNAVASRCLPWREEGADVGLSP